MIKTFPLRIDEQTHKKLKVLAAENDTYVNSLIIEALELLMQKYNDESDIEFEK